jgi:amino acid transporter
MWVLTGFEGAADLAEETQLARRYVPRAVVTSMVVSAVIGFFMIIGLVINIDNLSAATSAPVPIFYILNSALGEAGAILFEAVAMVALYAGGLAGVAATSRLLFSMSRDGMLPASSYLAKVDPRSHAPSHSLWLIAVIAVGLVVAGTYIATQTIALIVGMAAIGYYLLYALTMGAVIYATIKGRLVGRSGFDLGRWAGPVRWIALIWAIAVVLELSIPTANQQTALMAGVFYLLAIAWWFFVLRGRINRGEAGTPGERQQVRDELERRALPKPAVP